MNKKLYIAFNCNLTNHDWSISLLDTEKGIFSIQLERIDRLKHSPALNDGYHGKLSEFLNKKALGNFSSKNYFKKVYKYLNEYFSYNTYEKIFVINPPKDISYEDMGILNLNYEIINLKSHHIFHASSAFYASEFKESAVLSMDYNGIVEEGVVDNNENTLMAMQNVYHFDGNKEKLLFNTNFSNKNKYYGIGLAYDIFSSFIGLEEGSVMGLSSYGESKKFESIKIFEYTKEGHIYLNKIFTNGINNKYLENYWNSFSDFIIDNIYKVFGISKQEVISSKENIQNSILADIAAKLQKETEDAIVYLANKAYNLTKSKNICLAGGVALNILANKAILDRTPFENIFVQPASDDSGLSIGECYYSYHVLHNNTKRFSFNKIGFGKKYSDNYIKFSLENYNEFLSYIKYDNISERTSDLLLKGNIIGFFQGGCEYGPRALGNRSIIAIPSSKNKNKVNDIKSRERWRPLAPIILEEYLEEYFDTNYKSEYMTLVSNVKNITKEVAPGIVHVDGTSRYQTVNKNSGAIYNLIENLYEKSNNPIVINTSLNYKGEPIVESPQDAIRMFLSTNLDYLIVGNYIVNKQNIFKDFIFTNNQINIHNLIINNKEKDINIIKLNNLYDIIFDKLAKIIFISGIKGKKIYNTFDGNFSFNLEKYGIITIGFGRLEGDFKVFKNISDFNIGFTIDNNYYKNILLNIEKNSKEIKKYLYLYIKELKNIKDIVGIKDDYE